MPRSFALSLLLLLVAAAPAAAADPRRGAQWNLDLIEADAARAVSTGAGAIVAVIDSGVQADHPDLAGRIGPSYDVVQRDATPQDGDGHGTHVMGIVGAATGNGVGVESVAPGATLMAVRVLGDDGGGSIDDVARGIDWAREHGADVINLSLGSEVPLVGAGGGDSFDAAIRRAIAAGIVVVAAAGNNGVPVCEQPAAGDGLLCVGAVDKRRARSFFSSFGSGLGLVAPGGSGATAAGMEVGEDVLSTYAGSGVPRARGHVAGRAARRGGRGAAGRRAGCGVRRRCGGCSPRRRIWVRRGWTRSTGRGWSTRGLRWLGWAVGRRGLARVLRLGRRCGRSCAWRGARVRGVGSGCGCGRRARGSCGCGSRGVGGLWRVGSRRVRAGRASTVVARLTRRGRRVARPFKARVKVRLPGERKWRVRVVSVRRDDRCGERQLRLGREWVVPAGWVICGSPMTTLRTAAPFGLPLNAQLTFAGPSYPPPMPLDRPDVLVLAGGGTLGEAWMRSLLDGATTAAGIDFRECEYFVGTSAGSIVAAFLAAGRAPDSGAEARVARDWADAADGNGNGRGASPCSAA